MHELFGKRVSAGRFGGNGRPTLTQTLLLTNLYLMTRLAKPLLLKTPCCAEMVIKQRYASFNSFGLSSRWSDGYVSMPFVSEVAAMAYCPGCNKTYWLEDASELGVVPSRTETRAQSNWFSRLFNKMTNVSSNEKVADVDLLELDYVDYHQQPRPADLLLAVLREEWSNTEREAYMRTRLWWIGNHQQRGRRLQSPMTGEQANDNMRHLLALHQSAPQADDNAELIAELLRQLGRFDEAISALNVFREKSAKAKMIEAAASQRESRVFEVESF